MINGVLFAGAGGPGQLTMKCALSSAAHPA